MTTIAVNKKSIACDLQLTHHTGIKLKCSSKIIQLPDNASKLLFNKTGAYMGYSGNANLWGEVVQWLHLLKEKSPDTGDQCEFLVLVPGGHIYYGTNMKNWTELNTKHFGVGSGGSLAMAAMEAGKTPKEAVMIASKLDPQTGMGSKEYFI